MRRDLLPAALADLGIAGRDAAEATEVLLLAADEDGDGDGLVGLDNFAAAVRQPLALERWAMGVPLWRHLAAAVEVPAGADPLRAVAALTPADAARVARAVGEAAESEILAQAEALRRSFADADAEAAATAPPPPTIVPKFRIHKAGCGTVQDYREHFKSDLGSRIGRPGPARPAEPHFPLCFRSFPAPAVPRRVLTDRPGRSGLAPRPRLGPRMWAGQSRGGFGAGREMGGGTAAGASAAQLRC